MILVKKITYSVNYPPYAYKQELEQNPSKYGY
jgi:hypothetical protein